MARYQRKDAYHQQAKREGLRSRAAYKLDEIQGAQKILRRGQKVLDLGCWPGGWMQVAAKIVGPGGRVVGVDRARVDPPFEEEWVVSLEGDLGAADIAQQLLDALGAPADVLLCDAAPKLTGIRERDRAAEEELLLSVEGLIPSLLRPGGDLVLKILEGPEAQASLKRIRKGFGSARSLVPKATRKGSSERYLLARKRLAQKPSEQRPSEPQRGSPRSGS